MNFRFSGKVSKPTKASNKYHLFYNTVLLKKTPLILQTTSHSTLQKCTRATQPKALLILQIFQQVCFWLVSDKTFALHHF